MTRPNSARLTIVLPASVDQRLREIAARDGRSISNLAAHLLHQVLNERGADGRP